MKTWLATLFLVAGACGVGPVSAAEPTTNLLSGVVIEKRANVKSFEAWNSPSDPYYVLDMGDFTETYIEGTNKWKATRKQHVTLRPSDAVPTEALKRLKGKQVQLKGRHVEGQPYKPVDHAEQVPMEPDILTKPDGTVEFVGLRPARSGSGFSVEEVVSQTEIKKAPNQTPEDMARKFADPQRHRR